MKEVVWCGSQKIILLLLLWSLVFYFFMKVLVLLIKENINNYNIDLNIPSALHLPPPGHWGKYYQMTQSANLTFKLLSSFSMAVIGAKVFMNINNNHHCKWISWQQILRYFYIQNIRIWYWPAARRANTKNEKCPKPLLPLFFWFRIVNEETMQNFRPIRGV